MLHVGDARGNLARQDVPQVHRPRRYHILMPQRHGTGLHLLHS